VSQATRRRTVEQLPTRTAFALLGQFDESRKAEERASAADAGIRSGPKMAREPARKRRFSLDAVDRLRAEGGAAAVEVQRPGASCKAGSWRQIRSSVGENAPLLAVVGAYILTCLALRAVTGHPDLTPINDSTVAVGWRYLFVAAALPLGYHLIAFLLARLRRTGDRRRVPLIEEWTEYRNRHLVGPGRALRH
jgi:hypothetical protein